MNEIDIARRVDSIDPCYSYHAVTNGIINSFEDSSCADNAQIIKTKIITPLMTEFNDLLITSFYRGKELNAALGGVKFSYHLRGLALDFLFTKSDPLKVLSWINENLEFDVCIFYIRKNGSYFFHIQYEIDGVNVSQIKVKDYY